MSDLSSTANSIINQIPNGKRFLAIERTFFVHHRALISKGVSDALRIVDDSHLDHEPESHCETAQPQDQRHALCLETRASIARRRRTSSRCRASRGGSGCRRRLRCLRSRCLCRCRRRRVLRQALRHRIRIPLTLLHARIQLLALFSRERYIRRYELCLAVLQTRHGTTRHGINILFNAVVGRLIREVRPVACRTRQVEGGGLEDREGRFQCRDAAVIQRCEEHVVQAVGIAVWE